MGFGKKPDFESGRTLDLDKIYKSIIKPSVEAAGMTCIRADDIIHSGPIDVPMYEQLPNADVVVADLSVACMRKLLTTLQCHGQNQQTLGQLDSSRLT
jgi:hypothetical protein